MHSVDHGPLAYLAIAAREDRVSADAADYPSVQLRQRHRAARMGDARRTRAGIGTTRARRADWFAGGACCIRGRYAGSTRF
ncbi:hypothetical protein LG3211_2412 [Lysobacter gummosus]|nr:hypothetical protein LG3211_2412 [Lysobacter gummosus]